MNETDIKRSIKNYLMVKGWFCFSLLQGLGSYKGAADIFAIKNGHSLWIEVKTEKGYQTRWQKQFEKDITDNGGHYILARSYEDVENYIKEVLS